MKKQNFLPLAFLFISTLLMAQIPDNLSKEQKEKVLDYYQERDNDLEKEGRLTPDQKERSRDSYKNLRERIDRNESTDWRSHEKVQKDAIQNNVRNTPVNNITGAQKSPIIVQRTDIVFMGSPASVTSNISPGHAYIIVEQHMSDGSVRKEAYGFYGNGLQVEKYVDPTRINRSQEYMRKSVTPQKFKNVMEDLRNVHSNNDYKYFTNNCVGFVDKIAKELSIKTPERSSWTFPSNYLRELNLINSDAYMKMIKKQKEKERQEQIRQQKFKDEADKAMLDSPKERRVTISNCNYAPTLIDLNDLPPGMTMVH